MKPILNTASKPSMLLWCGMGLGTYWAWNYTFIASTVDSFMWLTNVAAHLCALVLVVAGGRRGAPFSSRPFFIIAVPACMTLGTLLFHSSWLYPEAPFLAQWISSIVVGLSSALLLVLWSEAYARFAIVREQELVSYCGVIAGFAFYLAMAYLPWAVQITLVACLPVVSATCTGVVNAASKSDIKATRARSSFPPYKTMLPVRLLLCAFVFAIPMGYFKNSFAGDWTIINSIALLLVVCAVAVETLFKRKASSSLFPKMLILLLSGGLLILPLFSDHMVISGALIIVGSFIFRAYLYQICGIISVQTRSLPSTVFALATCMLDAGWIVGISLRTALHGMPASWFAYTTAGIAYLVFAIGLVLISRRFDYFELNVPGQEDGTEQGPDDELRARGERIAVDFSLTRREKEVAVLLAGGKSIQQIADDITLSRNTVKTHANHVYQKCGVHSKDELMNLFKQHEC